MLGILLTILKIIGIIFICILGLILLLVLMVLFVPLRYKAEGEYKSKKPKVQVKASYLCHIISVSISYIDKLDFSIRIFGIKLRLKKKTKDDTKNKASIGANISKETSADNTTSADSTSTSDIKESSDGEIANENISAECNNYQNNDINDNCNVEPEGKNENIEVKESTDDIDKDDSHKASKNAKNIKKEKLNDDKKSFGEKLEDFKDNIDYWKDLITKDSTRRAFEVCIHRIGMLFKSILPRKGYFKVWLGLEDAGLTGKIVGAYWALYRYIGKVVNLYAYYDKQIIEAEFKLSGKIVPFSLLIQLILIYFDKDCHRLIHLFIKKSKESKK